MSSSDTACPGSDGRGENSGNSDMYGVETCVETYDSALEAAALKTAAVLSSYQDMLLNASDFSDEPGAAVSPRERRQFIDVGCGSGSFTLKHLLPQLPAWCERLVAVDVSNAMLKFAREKRADPRIEYMELDLMAKDKVSEFVRNHGHFQRVYSVMALHWMTDQHQALKSIELLMAPGGECLLYFAKELDVHGIFTAVKNSPRWTKYSHVFEGLLPETTSLGDTASVRSYAADLVQAANLTALACEVFHTNSMIGLDTSAAADFFTLLNPVYKLLEAGEQEDLRRFTLGVIQDIRKRRASEGKTRDFILIHAYKPKN